MSFTPRRSRLWMAAFGALCLVVLLGPGQAHAADTKALNDARERLNTTGVTDAALVAYDRCKAKKLHSCIQAALYFLLDSQPDIAEGILERYPAPSRTAALAAEAQLLGNIVMTGEARLGRSWQPGKPNSAVVTIRFGDARLPVSQLRRLAELLGSSELVMQLFSAELRAGQSPRQEMYVYAANWCQGESTQVLGQQLLDAIPSRFLKTLPRRTRVGELVGDALGRRAWPEFGRCSPVRLRNSANMLHIKGLRWIAEERCIAGDSRSCLTSRLLALFDNAHIASGLTGDLEPALLETDSVDELLLLLASQLPSGQAHAIGARIAAKVSTFRTRAAFAAVTLKAGGVLTDDLLVTLRLLCASRDELTVAVAQTLIQAIPARDYPRLSALNGISTGDSESSCALPALVTLTGLRRGDVVRDEIGASLTIYPPRAVRLYSGVHELTIERGKYEFELTIDVPQRATHEVALPGLIDVRISGPGGLWHLGDDDEWRAAPDNIVQRDAGLYAVAAVMPRMMLARFEGVLTPGDVHLVGFTAEGDGAFSDTPHAKVVRFEKRADWASYESARARYLWGLTSTVVGGALTLTSLITMGLAIDSHAAAGTAYTEYLGDMNEETFEARGDVVDIHAADSNTYAAVAVTTGLIGAAGLGLGLYYWLGAGDVSMPGAEYPEGTRLGRLSPWFSHEHIGVTWHLQW